MFWKYHSPKISASWAVVALGFETAASVSPPVLDSEAAFGIWDLGFLPNPDGNSQASLKWLIFELESRIWHMGFVSFDEIPNG